MCAVVLLQWVALPPTHGTARPGAGVPALAVLDSDGSLLTSQKRGEFTSVARLGPHDIVAFLETWKPSRAR